DPRQPARHGLDADELRLHELARGRRRRAAEGLRGGVRAVDDRAAAQRGGPPSDGRHAATGGQRAGREAAHDREVDPMDPMMPPPVRRIVVDRDPYVATPASTPNGSATATVPAHPVPARPAVTGVRERMRVESVWLAYGDRWVVR